MDNEVFDYIKYNSSSCRDVTIVTAFYNLEKYEKRPETRPAHKYKESWKELSKINVNIVLFCDPEEEQNNLRVRSSYGNKNKTKIYPIPFSDTPWYQYAETVERNIQNKMPVTDGTNKDTSKYFIVNLNKTFFMKTAAEDNPFNSKKIAWLDYGIYIHIDEPENIYWSLSNYPENKVRLFLITRFENFEMDDLDEYFRVVHRGKVGGGNWGGGIEPIKQFCDNLQEKYRLYLSQGYAFNDESIMGILYKSNPEKYDCSFGDYKDYLSNSGAIMHFTRPIHMMIHDSWVANDQDMCYRATYELFNSPVYQSVFHEMEPHSVLYIGAYHFTIAFYRDINEADKTISKLLEHAKTRQAFALDFKNQKDRYYHIFKFTRRKDDFNKLMEIVDSA